MNGRKDTADFQKASSFYLIQFDNIWYMVFLFQLLLSFEQLVHAVVTTANLLIILLLQHGSNTAEAADAAPPGAHPTAAASWCDWLGMDRASSYAEGLSCPANQFLCKQSKGLWPDSTMILEILDFTLYSRAKGKGTNSMHFLHMMDPQRRQWCLLFRMLNLFPQSGQNGTSESFTHDTTDFSMAFKNYNKDLFSSKNKPKESVINS